MTPSALLDFLIFLVIYSPVAAQQALVSGNSLRQQQSPSLVGGHEGITVGGWAQGP